MTSFIHINDIEHVRAAKETPQNIWAPTEAVVCHEVEVPKVSEQKWRAMIPWMLEERLLERPEQMEFICGKKNSNNLVPVLVTSKARLQAWRDQLAQSGVVCRALVPDFFALSWQPGTCTLAIIGNRCIIRSGVWQGAAGPTEFILPLLENMLSPGENKLVIYCSRQSCDVPEHLRAIATLHTDVEIFDTTPESWLSLFTQPAQSGDQKNWFAPAKVVVLLAAILCACAVTSTVLETRRINTQAAWFESELKRAYQQYFGTVYDFGIRDFQKVVSRQLNNNVTGNAGQSYSLSLLDKVAPWLANCTNCRINRITANTDSVDVLIASSAATAPENLPLAGQGFRAELSSGESDWVYRVVAEDAP